MRDARLGIRSGRRFGTLVKAIRATHGVDATWLKIVPVVERFRGEVAWEGVVEVIAVTHPKATRVYAWTFLPSDQHDHTRTITVLGAGPVVDAQTAARAAILAEARKGVN